jgi:glycosyltransferase involved in cell wall biosynthesis
MNASDNVESLTIVSPLVSIVVNNYNNARFLGACLEALLNQTYLNIEIVVVDALSTDNSRSIIDLYAQKDSRIKRVYCSKYERYPAITYNMGFLNCTANFVAINDPDDISFSNRIEAQINYLLENPNVDAVGCNCFEFNDEFNILVETTVEKNVQNAAPPVRNPCLMLRKEVLAAHGLWKWQCEYAADFEWLLRFYAGGVKFYNLQTPYVKYRKSASNISSTKLFNQGLKVAKFRTLYGLILFRQVGLAWWYATLRTYAFLLLKYPFKIILKKFNKD